jgi:hypothetical protein
MDKILLVGNININSNFKSCDTYIKNFIIPLTDGISDIFFFGLFDSSSISTSNLNYLQSLFERLEINIHIILNNHDRKVLDLFKYTPNVTIYNSPTLVNNIYIIPFGCSKENIPKNDYIFCNTDHSLLSDYRVFSGLNTTPKSSKNFTYIGNAFDLNKDDNGTKGVYIIDEDISFKENNISLKHRVINITSESDLDNLDTKDYLHISILNSLVDNRKIRRRLEDIKFESIIYIDDIIDIEVDPISSINIEYKDIIINYIDKNVDSDNKEGVLKEFDNILNIYNLKHL